MKKLFIKNKNQKGYAILFTIVIVSAVSVITAGLTNATYKQLILSSLAKDSQSAFYQADTAGDCALYADQVEYEGKYKLSTPEGIFTTPAVPWSCGGLTLKIENVRTTLPGGYELNPPDPNANTPCFRITVTKTVNSTDPEVTDIQIKAKGYNICNMGNLRTVEREIQIDYEN